MRANGFIRRLAAGTIILAVSGAATVFGGLAANAAPPPSDGSLTLTPATGSDTTVFKFRTPAGCPTTANSYNGIVKGPNGFDSTVVNTLSAGISFTGPFSVELSNTMLAISQFIRKPIVSGEYDIFLNCVDDFTGQVFRSFTTAIYFTDPTHYTLTAPTATGTTTRAGASDGAGGTAPSASPADTNPPATGARPETAVPVGLVFLGGSILLAAVLILVVWQQRRRKGSLGRRARHSE